MENTRTVCRQVADRSLPRSNNHGRGQTSRERSPRENGRREWPSKTVIIVEKVCPSKYKVATKTNKMEERKIYTNC